MATPSLAKGRCPEGGRVDFTVTQEQEQTSPEPFIKNLSINSKLIL